MHEASEYQRQVAAAVMKAIFDVSMIESEGARTAYIMTDEVVAALVNVMAAIVEGAPGCETSQGMQKTAEGIGRKLVRQMHEMRDIIDETGERPFEAIYTRRN